MLMKCSFMSAATRSSSNDSRSITWHQWHVEYATDRKIGLSSARAFANASSPPGIPVHRVAGVLLQVGALLAGETVRLARF
jgi:hypothetical protein